MVVDLQLPLPIISKVVICGHDHMVVDLQLPVPIISKVMI